MSTMKAVGYVRVSTDKQADRGISLDAQAEKIRAMAVVHDAELLEIIVDGGESAKSLNRPGMALLLAMVDAGEVQMVIIAKLDRLTRSVKDLCTLLERFTRRGVALVSVAEIAGHGLGGRTARAEHHDGRKSMGTGSYRRADAGRSAPQAHQRRARWQYPVRLSAWR